MNPQRTPGGIAITMQEAFARIEDGATMNVRIQYVIGDGCWIEKWSRSKVEGRIKLNTCYESGPTAQSIDYGVYVYMVIFNGPQGPGVGMTFFKTKPQCRISDAMLAENAKRGYGENLFSGGDK